MKYKLVLIEWSDSYSEYEKWGFISDFNKPKIMKCRSVGYIIKENKDDIIIMPNISDNFVGAMGGLCIPKVSITKISKLKLNK